MFLCQQSVNLVSQAGFSRETELRHIIMIKKIKELGLTILGLSSLKPVGQAGGWKLSQDCTCSFEAELILLQETSAFVLSAYI